jgi:hypothetical protein
MNNLLGNQMGINPMGMNPMGMNQMGMNQMGMNQMGMNQMGMNQMGMNQMGMNPINMNPLGGVRIPPIPLWLLKWLTIFPVTGLLGFDHFALGSQFTGMTKLLVNMFTLGSWYAYDVVQVYYKKDIGEKGLKSPFIESGSVGKNVISTVPMEKMDYTTTLWLYILYTCAFAFAYLLTSRFISEADDILSVGFAYFNKILFFGTLGLAGFTLFYFLFFRSIPYISTQIPLPNTNYRSTLRSTYGLPTQRTSSSRVGSILSRMSGGGNTNTNTNTSIKELLQKIQNGGKSKGTNEIPTFLFILAILPIAGFMAYYLRKNKKSEKEDAIPRNTRSV